MTEIDSVEFGALKAELAAVAANGHNRGLFDVHPTVAASQLSQPPNGTRGQRG